MGSLSRTRGGVGTGMGWVCALAAQRFASLVGDFLTRGESVLVNPGAEASAA
jgi:hypothetical protein